jgi:hypothetical protein
MTKTKMNRLSPAQIELDFIVTDLPKRCADNSFASRWKGDFRVLIETTDWDRRLVEKYATGADWFCWGVVAASAVFFFHVGLVIILL